MQKFINFYILCSIFFIVAIYCDTNNGVNFENKPLGRSIYSELNSDSVFDKKSTTTDHNFWKKFSRRHRPTSVLRQLKASSVNHTDGVGNAHQVTAPSNLWFHNPDKSLNNNERTTSKQGDLETEGIVYKFVRMSVTSTTEDDKMLRNSRRPVNDDDPKNENVGHTSNMSHTRLKTLSEIPKPEGPVLPLAAMAKLPAIKDRPETRGWQDKHTRQRNEDTFRNIPSKKKGSIGNYRVSNESSEETATVRPSFSKNKRIKLKSATVNSTLEPVAGKNVDEENIGKGKVDGENVDGENVGGENADGDKVEKAKFDGENAPGENAGEENAPGENADGEDVDKESADGENEPGKNVVKGKGDGDNVPGENADGVTEDGETQEIIYIEDDTDETPTTNVTDATDTTESYEEPVDSKPEDDKLADSHGDRKEVSDTPARVSRKPVGRVSEAASEAAQCTEVCIKSRKICPDDLEEMGSYVVSLGRMNNGKVHYSCAGVVIGDYSVVMPAHCLDCRTLHQSAIEYHVYDTDGNRHQITDVLFFPDTRGVAYHDLAVVRLDEVFKVKDHEKNPATMAQETPTNASSCYVVYWANEFKELTFQKTEIKEKECEGVQKSLVESHLFCALSTDDNCLPDEGAPLFCDEHLVGFVTSVHKADCKDYPNVYTDLTKYRGWIDSNTPIRESSISPKILTSNLQNIVTAKLVSYFIYRFILSL